MLFEIPCHFVRADELTPVVRAGQENTRERQFLRKQDGFDVTLRRAVDGIEQIQSAGSPRHRVGTSEHARRFHDNFIDIRNVFQHVAADHHIEAGGGEGQRFRRAHPVVDFQLFLGSVAPCSRNRRG